jgi:hypothetical protein
MDMAIKTFGCRVYRAEDAVIRPRKYLIEADAIMR